jgi:uncharacterized protein
VTELITPTGRTRVVREPHRGSHERRVIYGILDEGLVCHVGFSVEGQPYVIPTTFARVGHEIYFHGSAASRMLRNLGRGLAVCVTVTLADGLALGQATLLDAPDEKLAALRAFTEKLLPGRWQEARQPNERELKATSILRLGLTEASAKIRVGPVEDDAEDYALQVWAGVIPLRIVAGEPERDARCDAGMAVPGCVGRFARREPQ